MCGEIKAAEYFPFKTVNECYLCYERRTGKVLRAFRNKFKVADAYFKPEVEPWYIDNYLKLRKMQGQPIQFFYRDERFLRKYYQYNFDNKYIYVSFDGAKTYKFLINKIRNVQT